MNSLAHRYIMVILFQFEEENEEENEEESDPTGFYSRKADRMGSPWKLPTRRVDKKHVFFFSQHLLKPDRYLDSWLLKMFWQT